FSLFFHTPVLLAIHTLSLHDALPISLGDVIAARFPQNNLRFTMAISTFIISIFYMIPQLVASVLLIRLLLDIDYSTSVLVIGSLDRKSTRLTPVTFRSRMPSSA